MAHHLKTDILHITFKNRDAGKLNDTKKTCLLKLNITLCCSLSLNTCEYLICQINQRNCSLLKNHTHFHLKILL